MAIQKEFILRYRSEGHLRFQIPQRATHEQVAQLIVDKITAIEGVESVRLFRRSKKMVIRYREDLCGFIELAKQLHVALASLEQQGWFTPQAVTESHTKSRFGLKAR